MNTGEPGLTTISRTVVALARDAVHTVERVVSGDSHRRTARENAWEAVCADRARAERQAELRRLVAALAGPAPHRETTVRTGPGSGDRIG
ncbi:hypothetical protein V6U90_26685 [Micromonospora sp. CPCC 206060]|uniref:hypothetical protein n=1 Tax=Micromonospora sp. CPCC 206060 TaxID=3122406 RepID=UPI002FF36041